MKFVDDDDDDERNVQCGVFLNKVKNLSPNQKK